MIYLAILVYILILVYIYDIKRSSKGFVTHYRLLLAVFILVAGLSYRLGIDLIRAEESFSYAKVGISLSSYIKIYEWDNGTEPLWRFTMGIVRSLTSEFFVWHLIVAAAFNITVFWFLRKYSPAFFTSVFLYAIFSYCHFNFEVLRESLSLVFILIGLSYLFRDKPRYITYFLLIIPAVLFHRFAYIAVLLPLVKFVKNNGVYIALVVVVASISVTLISQNLGFYINLLLGEDASTALDFYLQGDAADLNYKGYIFIFIMTLIPFYWIITACSKKNAVFLSWGLVYLLFLILSNTSIYLFSRVLDFLLFPTLVAMSDAIKTSIYHLRTKGKDFRSKVIMMFVLFVYLSVHIYNTTHSVLFQMYYPYSSIIDKSTDAQRERFYDYLLN